MSENSVFRSYKQGGRRYKDVLSSNGERLNLLFEDNLFQTNGCLRRQVVSSLSFKPMSSEDFFGVSVPLSIEIGAGNGEFIMHKAQNGGFWVGFEPEKEVFFKAVKRIKKSELKNVRLIQFDAELFIELLPSCSADSFYINFPDPWPKRRHNKRRLLKDWFIELLTDRLMPCGKIYIVTDHEDYASEISESIKTASKNLNGALFSVNETAFIKDVGSYYRTKYYRKFAENEVYFFEYEKK